MMLQCKSDAISGKALDSEQARFLMDVGDEYLSLLASSADEITREINGIGVDVEQLHNIKKNMCSEDCTFCGQSAFYNTGIDTYELPPADEIVHKARDAKEQGSESYCLVAAWKEPDDFDKVCDIIRRIVRDEYHFDNSQVHAITSLCFQKYYDDRLETLHIAQSCALLQYLPYIQLEIQAMKSYGFVQAMHQFCNN